MGNGQFKLALDRLNKMMPSDKSTSAFLLLSIVCGYQVNSTAEMLQKVADSPMAIQKLIFRPDWDIIASRKPGTGDFPFFIKEYFALCLMQNGTSVRELRMKTRGPQKGVRRSTLAMIDEEDSHNAERAAQLKAARNSSYRTLEERLESMDDRLDEYASSYFSEPSWYYERLLQERDEVRAMAAAAEARRTSVPRLSESAPTEETTPFPQVRPNMTPEEIVARKEELIRLISKEEQKILE